MGSDESDIEGSGHPAGGSRPIPAEFEAGAQAHPALVEGATPIRDQGAIASTLTSANAARAQELAQALSALLGADRGASGGTQLPIPSSIGPAMDPPKILEWARAIIYAAATGIVIHVAGTNLHEEHAAIAQSPAEHLVPWTPVLDSFLVSLAVLFIIMDGVARHCVRHTDEWPSPPLPKLRAARFILEVAGVFFFCYWASLIISADTNILRDGVNDEGKPFLVLFALCCFFQNLIGFMVVLVKRHPEFNSLWYLYGAPRLIVYYFKTVFLRDVLEMRINGKRSEPFLVHHISLLRKDLILLHTKMSRKSEVALFQHGRAAWLRIRAQTKWIHIGAMHLVGAVIFMPISWWNQLKDMFAWHGAPQDIGSLLVKNTTETAFVSVILGIGVFLTYYITSNLEHSRFSKLTTGNTTLDVAEGLTSIQVDEASWQEKANQGAGNLLLVGLYIIGLWYCATEIIYLFYFFSMSHANAAVLFPNQAAASQPGATTQ